MWLLRLLCFTSPSDYPEVSSAVLCWHVNIIVFFFFFFFCFCSDIFVYPDPWRFATILANSASCSFSHAAPPLLSNSS